MMVDLICADSRRGHQAGDAPNCAAQTRREGIYLPINSFSELNDLHKSVLQEICNMGAGNTATAVSQMISTPTDISTPQVKIIPPALAGKVADALCKDGLAFLIRLHKDVTGALLFIFPCPFIERLANAFFPGTEVKSADEVDDMTASLVGETVNLSAASYANSISLLTGGMTVDISTPKGVKAPSADILSIVGEGSPAICSVSNTIEITDCHYAYTALFYPELNSVRTILDNLGMG